VEFIKHDGSGLSCVPEFKECLVYFYEQRPSLLRFLKYNPVIEIDRLRSYLKYRKENHSDCVSKKVYQLLYGSAWEDAYRGRRKSIGKHYDVPTIMKNHNLSEAEAEEIVSKRKKSTSGNLDRYVDKYGAQKGIDRYIEFCELSGFRNTLEGKKDLYGENEGQIKFKAQSSKHAKSMTTESLLSSGKDAFVQKRIDTLRNMSSPDDLIRIYGEEAGVKKWKKYALAKLVKKGSSKESLRIMSCLYPSIRMKPKQEVPIVSLRHTRAALIDFTYDETKVAVEFDGVAFHACVYHPTFDPKKWKRAYSSGKADIQNEIEVEGNRELAINDCGYKVARISSLEARPEFFNAFCDFVRNPQEYKSFRITKPSLDNYKHLWSSGEMLITYNFAHSKKDLSHLDFIEGTS
jgi:hypothetical protein